MPNITGLKVGQDGYLLQVTYGAGGHAEITQAEAQAYLDANPGRTNAQIESWLNTQLQNRWAGRTDTPYIHIVQRSPVVIQVLIARPGEVVPADWWVG